MQNNRSAWQEHASVASSDFLEKVGFKLSLKGNVRVSQIKGRRKKSGPNRTWRLTDQDSQLRVCVPGTVLCTGLLEDVVPAVRGFQYRESNRHCVTNYVTRCHKITLGLGAEC